MYRAITEDKVKVAAYTGKVFKYQASVETRVGNY